MSENHCLLVTKEHITCVRVNRTEYIFSPDLSDASCMVGDGLTDFMVVVRERLLTEKDLKARRK